MANNITLANWKQFGFDVTRNLKPYKIKQSFKAPQKHAEHRKEVNNFSFIKGSLLNGKIWAFETMTNMYVS